jgi:hypothetical protein
MYFISTNDQQEAQLADGAGFGTSELICFYITIINGFPFPYPLNCKIN